MYHENHDRYDDVGNISARSEINGPNRHDDSHDMNDDSHNMNNDSRKNNNDIFCIIITVTNMMTRHFLYDDTPNGA